MITTMRTFLLGVVLGSVSLAAAATQTVTYFHNDLAGSPVAATNASGQVVWRESYRPYGERRTNSPAASGNDIWFTSRRQDAETGLVYMGARYYDPVAGRFVSTDPAGFDEANVHSFNRYAYANNNPYRYVDPDGRQAAAIVPLVAGALIVGGGFAASPEQQRAIAGGLNKIGEYSLFGRLGAIVGQSIFNESANTASDTSGGERGTVSRPSGIPDNWREEPTKTEGGTQWINPDNAGDRVRAMPGNPNSQNPGQREPYVRDVRNGNQWLDVNGNRIEGRAGRNSPDTHIPANDYVFRP